jgi:predicted benzoate:H+ symporter BenE
MLCSFLACSFFVNAGPKKRIMSAAYFILVGGFWSGPGILLITTSLSGAAGIGLYLATAASAAIVIGGLLQVSDNLNGYNNH